MFDYLYATTWPYPISNSCNWRHRYVANPEISCVNLSSLRCVLLLLAVVATQLSAAWLGLDQLSFPLNLFSPFGYGHGFTWLCLVAIVSFSAVSLSLSLILAWQLNCLKKVDTQDEAELALYRYIFSILFWLLLFAILPSLVPSFLCLPACLPLLAQCRGLILIL